MKLEVNMLVNAEEVRLMQRKGAGTLAVIRVGLLLVLMSLLVNVWQGQPIDGTLTAGLGFFSTCLLVLVGGNAWDKVNDTTQAIKTAPKTPTPEPGA